jgi:GT2 family glycosyltransferase
VKPRVSVVIPTYRDADLLARSLPVFVEFGDSTEVIVANNDPERDVTEIVSAAHPQAKVIDIGYPSGFGNAANTAILASEGEFVLVLNADVFLSPNYIPAMLDFFHSHPRAGCAGGKLYRYDFARDIKTNVIDTAGIRLGRNRRPMARGEGQLDTGAFAREEQLFGVDGAGLFVRRTALESIRIDDEFFDSIFYLHKDDTDLSWRIRLAGWESWFVPQATGWHARTTRGLGDQGYLSAIRDFHKNEADKPVTAHRLAMRNQWLLLIKNEDGANLVRDLPYILARETAVVAHNVLFSPRSMAAFADFVRVWRPTLRKRRIIKKRQAISPREMRRWLG